MTERRMFKKEIELKMQMTVTKWKLVMRTPNEKASVYRN